MYGPSEEDMRILFRSIAALSIAALACAFFLGRCTAGYTFEIKSPGKIEGKAPPK